MKCVSGEYQYIVKRTKAYKKDDKEIIKWQ